jgi:hypothetical protein
MKVADRCHRGECLIEKKKKSRKDEFKVGEPEMMVLASSRRIPIQIPGGA